MSSVLAIPPGHFGILHFRVLGSGVYVIGRSTGALENDMMEMAELQSKTILQRFAFSRFNNVCSAQFYMILLAPKHCSSRGHGNPVSLGRG